MIKKILVAAAALLGVIATPAAAAIVYDVNQTIGNGSVIGTITTDGATGILGASDITDWSLDLNGVGASFHVTPLDSIVTDYGNDVTATAQYLYFNFSGTAGDLLLFQNGGPNGQQYYCNAVSSGECYQGKSVVPIYYSDSTSQFSSAGGNQIIGTAVPEPAAWAMLLLGFFGVGSTLRAARRKSAVVTA